MYKIAAMGDKDSIYGFASIGLEIFPITDPQEGIHTLRKIIDGGYAVIYITEQLATQIESELDRYRSLPIPAIIPIPGVSGNTGVGMRNVSKSVEQAVGSDILS
ncbi:MAG: V-type ATP synthase subunit F, partial [Oscillospiraceae bacterium]